MKKLLVTVFIFILLIMIINSKESEENKEEIKGVFISYIDYSILKGKNASDMKKEIDIMFDNIKSYNLNSIILQVSAFSDAIYYSNINLSSKSVVLKEGDKLPIDILSYFIDKGKKYNIDIYAWINPYRIRNNNDPASLNKNAYYYKWINTNNIEMSKTGIYLNPAKDEVIDYITSVIKEICLNYNIKGILFDDYFYPNKTIDLKDINNNTDISSFRINNINKLIKKSYLTVKSIDKDIQFGISPSGNIENNLNNLYLDIENILKSNYIDFIVPQLYYGFENTNKPYIKTLNTWSSISKDKDFYVGLSLYKSGKEDIYALNGKNEWIENSDIIKRQIISARKKDNYKGFYIFRYDHLVSKANKNIKNEQNNLKSITVK